MDASKIEELPDYILEVELHYGSYDEKLRIWRNIDHLCSEDFWHWKVEGDYYNKQRQELRNQGTTKSLQEAAERIEFEVRRWNGND